MPIDTVVRYAPHRPMILDAMAMAFPPVAGEHPNRVPWSGILTQVDRPSTRAPHGADSHRVLIPRAVAEAALPSLMGMPVNFSETARDHDKRQPVGTITEAYIDGANLHVCGILFGKNFPDIVATIQANQSVLGMSYELSDCVIQDPGADIWTLTHCLFTGAAILRKDAAAYQQTAIAAAAEEEAMEATAISRVEELKIAVDVLASQHDADQAALAAAEEAEALAAEAEATRAISAAMAALADHDAEDAAAHRAVAATKLQAAALKRATALKRQTTLLAQAGEDAEAAAPIQEAITRLEAQQARHTEMAASIAPEAEGEGDTDAAKAKEPDEDDMLEQWGAYQKFKKYVSGTTYTTQVNAKESQRAAHDDEAEDIALFKRMMNQKKNGGEQSAAGTTDLALRRQLRSLQAAQTELRASMELLTDTVSRLAGLLTDTVAARDGLTTDAASRGNNGGAVRKTMQAIGEAWVSKNDQGTETPKKSLGEWNAQWKAEGLDERQRMARELDARAQNLVS